MGFGQLIEVVLQGELIEVFEANILEWIDQICLDDDLLHLGGLFPPVRLLKWQVLTAHTSIPREGELDYLAEAETAFAPPQPKKTASKKTTATPTPIKAAKKSAAKKTTAKKEVAA
jgi:hypothetical protein